MLGLAKKIFGSKNDRDIKRIRSTIQQINALEPSMKALRDEDFPRRTAVLKQKIAQ